LQANEGTVLQKGGAKCEPPGLHVQAGRFSIAIQVVDRRRLSDGSLQIAEAQVGAAAGLVGRSTFSGSGRAFSRSRGTLGRTSGSITMIMAMVAIGVIMATFGVLVSVRCGGRSLDGGLRASDRPHTHGEQATAQRPSFCDTNHLNTFRVR
jgi:hypothetical protein